METNLGTFCYDHAIRSAQIIAVSAADERRRLVSAVTIYETGIVIGARCGWDSVGDVTALLEEPGIEMVPFAEPYITAALAAYRCYGKGLHPKARLNLGDRAA